MAVGVVATYNGSYHSPGFDITVSGLSGFDTLTVERIDLTGEDPDTPVRGADQIPVTGSSFAITDFEAPIGKNLVYRATATSKTVGDTFTRTVASGWGIADPGLPWDTSSATAVDGVLGVGVHTHSAGSATQSSTLAPPLIDITDVDLTLDTSWSQATPTGGDFFMFFDIRYRDSSNHYRLNLVRKPDLTVTAELVLIHSSGGGSMTGSTAVPGAVPADALRIRFQAVGEIIRCKVWVRGTTEPAGWILTAINNQIRSGGIRLASFLGTGNTNTKPVSARFDNLTLTAVGKEQTAKSVGTSSSVGVQDTFSRTASSGWGPPDVGAPWTIRKGTIAAFSAVNGVGRMAITDRSPTDGELGNNHRISSPLNHTDLDQKVRVRAVAMPSGDKQRLSMFARAVDDTTWVALELAIDPLGVVQLRIGQKTSNIGNYTSPVTIPGITYTAGSWHWLRFQVVGDNYRAKVWADGASEPVGWQIETTIAGHPSGTFTALQGYGSAFSTNPTPEIVEWDDYSVTILDLTTVIPADNPGSTWVKSVGVPSLSRRANVSDWSTTTRPGRVLGEYQVLGRRNKVVLTDVLGGREGTLTFTTYRDGPLWQSDCTSRDFEALIAAGGTLLLQNAGRDLTGEEDMYFEVTNFERSRVGVVGGDFVHMFKLNFIEVDRPASSSESLTLRDWQDVLDQNSTWQDVLDSHPTWLDVLQRNL